jgi:hypothetical protein
MAGCEILIGMAGDLELRCGGLGTAGPVVVLLTVRRTAQIDGKNTGLLLGELLLTLESSDSTDSYAT